MPRRSSRRSAGIEAPRQPEVDEQQARVRRRAGLVHDEQVPGWGSAWNRPSENTWAQ